MLDDHVCRCATSSPPGVQTPPEMSETATTLRAPLGQLRRRDAADVPEPLHDAALLGEVPAQPVARPLDHHHDAGAGRLAAGRPSRRSRSACPSRPRAPRSPICIEYVSIIQAIVCSFVAMSGAGMSFCGPDHRQQLDVKRRVSRSSSPSDSSRGLQRTPPFAPPYGSRRSAHFHVIHIASAAHSPSETSGS